MPSNFSPALRICPQIAPVPPSRHSSLTLTNLRPLNKRHLGCTQAPSAPHCSLYEAEHVHHVPGLHDDVDFVGGVPLTSAYVQCYTPTHPPPPLTSTYVQCYTPTHPPPPLTSAYVQCYTPTHPPPPLPSAYVQCYTPTHPPPPLPSAYVQCYTPTHPPPPLTSAYVQCYTWPDR